MCPRLAFCRLPPTRSLPPLAPLLPALLQLYAKRLGPGPTAVQSMMLWGGCAGITAFW